ncbi:MAG: ABC transporter substrate-binding protein [Syntrophobacteraceae bacterium]|jgi:iron complex transport system substrate-binding protein
MKKVLVFVQAAILFWAVSAPADALAFTVKDAAGNDIEITPPVSRVVFLSLYELIPVFDVWDRVVGLNRWAFDNELLKRFPQLKEIPSVGTPDTVNIEVLLSLHPDLVITWSYKPEVDDFLVRRGLKVISVYPDSLEELYAVLDLCGRLFQKEDRAREIRSLMEKSFAETASKVSKIPPGNRRKVLWLWGKPTTVSGGECLANELIKLTGGINPAEGIKTKHPEVSMESIVGWDPDVIFIWGSARYGPEELLSNQQWKKIKAVRDGRVFKAPDLTTWSPTICSLALWMAWKTYPEYFDRKELSEEVLRFNKKCFGVPIKGLTFD